MTLTLEKLRETMRLLPPPLDEIEIRVNNWTELPPTLQADLLRACVAIQVDPMIPPGMALKRNLSKQRNLTALSSLEEYAACLQVIDLHPIPR